MPERAGASAAAGLPQAPDEEMPEGFSKKWAWFKYRYLANNSHNFFGRQIIANYLQGEAPIEGSIRSRTMRNATRVLLATRIYRAEHAGSLPKSALELTPILGPWPVDLYNGRPLRCDFSKGVVYGVGKDLKDDGGDIGSSIFGGGVVQGKDIGLRLAIRP